MPDAQMSHLPEATLRVNKAGSFEIHHGEPGDTATGNNRGGSRTASPAGSASRVARGGSPPAGSAAAPPPLADRGPRGGDSRPASNQASSNQDALMVTVQSEISKQFGVLDDRIRVLEAKVARQRSGNDAASLASSADSAMPAQTNRSDKLDKHKAEAQEALDSVVSKSIFEIDNNLVHARLEANIADLPEGEVTHAFVQAFKEVKIKDLISEMEHKVEMVEKSISALLDKLKGLQRDVPRFKRKQELQCIAVGLLAINSIDLPAAQRAHTVNDLEDRGKKLHAILLNADEGGSASQNYTGDRKSVV